MSVWEFTAVKASVEPTYAITQQESLRLVPQAKWFPEARLNFAQNILESPLVSAGQRHVLTGVREGGEEVEHVTLVDLQQRVARIAEELIRLDVRSLDRVACIGANSITTFTVFLAVASIGAIFTVCSPEMGEKGILDRFLQIKPKVLFADDFCVYNGKKIACLTKAQSVASSLQSYPPFKGLIVIPRFGDKYHKDVRAIDDLPEARLPKPVFSQLPFSHPLVIVYSSGTTGQPKCIVHTAGGVLLKQKVEQILCFDVKPDSVYLQYTTVSQCHSLHTLTRAHCLQTNWIMYLYSVTGLLSGARSVLYDGSPTWPSAEKFLQVLSRQKVTHFGTSAPYLASLEQKGFCKENMPPLDSLRVITSTGSVLSESQYYWIYKTFGSVQLSSVAGGTDIAGCCKYSMVSDYAYNYGRRTDYFLPKVVAGAPNLPVYAGWCQARMLGMKVQIFSDEGNPIEDSGLPGELVCTAPFPSQPAFFWGDEEGTKYRSAYFERYPGELVPNKPYQPVDHVTGLWHQGDYIQMDPETGGIQFLGRSDGVLNPSGKLPLQSILHAIR